MRGRVSGREGTPLHGGGASLTDNSQTTSERNQIMRAPCQT